MMVIAATIRKETKKNETVHLNGFSILRRCCQLLEIESFIMNVYRNIDRSKIQFDFLVLRDQKRILR